MARLRVREFGGEWQSIVVTFERAEHYSSSSLHRGRALRAYVVRRDGAVIGTVHEVTEALERRTRGATYVNARWTGSKTVWKAEGKPGRSRTRAEAVAALLGLAFGEVER